MKRILTAAALSQRSLATGAVVRHAVRRGRRGRRSCAKSATSRSRDRRRSEVSQTSLANSNTTRAASALPRHGRPGRQPGGELLAQAPNSATTTAPPASPRSAAARRSACRASANCGWAATTPTYWNSTVFDLRHQRLRRERDFDGERQHHHREQQYVRASNSIRHFLPPNLGGFYRQPAVRAARRR